MWYVSGDQPRSIPDCVKPPHSQPVLHKLILMEDRVTCLYGTTCWYILPST